MNKYRLCISKIGIIIVSLVAGLLMFPATALAGFGIDPGKVQIDNLYPGAEADFKIAVYNQNDYETTFTIDPRLPDYTKDDCEVFPHLDWITITPHEVTIKPSDKDEVTVAVLMPEDAEYYGKRSEAWISFKEKNDENMVQIEIVSRLLINTSAETFKEKKEDKSKEQPPLIPETSSPTSSKTEMPAPKAPAATSLEMSMSSTPAAAPPESQEGNTPWFIFGAVAIALVIFEGMYLVVKKRRKKPVD